LVCWGGIAGALLATNLAHYFAHVSVAGEIPWFSFPPELLGGWLLALQSFLCLLVSILLARRWHRAPRSRQLERLSRRGAVVLEAFALYFVLSIVAYFAPLLNETASTARVVFLWSCPGLAFAYALIRTRSLRTLCWDIGLNRGNGALVETLIGLAASALLCLPLLLRLNETRHFAAAALNICWPRYFSSVVFTPVVEEVFFRGMLYRHLRDRRSRLVGALLTTGVFALCHLPPGRWLTMILAGIVLAALREWRGSLIAPIVAHAASNLAVLLWVQSI
jgi:membrane protease YdiL (CAAX protease family)